MNFKTKPNKHLRNTVETTPFIKICGIVMYTIKLNKNLD